MTAQTTAVNAAVAAAIAKAAEQTDMREAQKGGGDYVPPAAGLCRLRFVGYVELGQHHNEKYGKTQEKVELVFELSGKNHAPKEVDGKLYPTRIAVRENLSLNEKAWFYKIFKAMNYNGEATHIAQLLGQDFLGTVHHNKVGDRVYANLRNESGYTIRAPFHEDLEGTVHRVEAGPQISETRCFLWDYCDKAMWDSLYIEGQYDEVKDDSGKVVKPARSKNVFQDQIRKAVNFPGSPIAELLADGDLDLTEQQESAVEEKADEPVKEETKQEVTEEHDPLADLGV